MKEYDFIRTIEYSFVVGFIEEESFLYAFYFNW